MEDDTWRTEVEELEDRRKKEAPGEKERRQHHSPWQEACLPNLDGSLQHFIGFINA